MNINELIRLIDIALTEIEDIVAKSSNLKQDHFQIVKTKQILHLLKEAVLSNPKQINERILRGVCDLGIYAYRYYENSTLEGILHNITKIIYREFPETKNLDPLGLEFGNENPI